MIKYYNMVAISLPLVTGSRPAGTELELVKLRVGLLVVKHCELPA
jgi:hypothetical protein